MVTVTEMEYVRASCCIHLDNGTRWWIRRDDLPQTGFREGAAYDEEAFQEKIRLCQYPRALNLIAGRHGRYDMPAFLQRNLPALVQSTADHPLGAVE